MLLFPGQNQQCSRFGRDEVTFRTHSVILRELSDSLRMRQHVLGAAKRDVAMIFLVDVRFCNEKPQHRRDFTSPARGATYRNEFSKMSFGIHFVIFRVFPFEFHWDLVWLGLLGSADINFCNFSGSVLGKEFFNLGILVPSPNHFRFDERFSE